ncbi:MAG: glycosyltransferase family 2 protein [Deltaproteobacteria bacterium]|nr:glycosyltransferase family 2 protein [Deltaproteobacteria bacterium]
MICEAELSEDQPVDFSIIIPVYDNEGSLKPTFERLEDAVFSANKGKSYEVIFVDDGSGDNSLSELLEIQQKNPQTVTVIKFTRNFGQGYARLAGYTHARGKCLIYLTADLQNPPELINQMLDCFFNQGYDVVIGTRKSRNESFYRRFTSKIFYTIIKRLSFPGMPVGGFDYHLISDNVKALILENREANPFFQGQLLWSGYRAKMIPYEREKRFIGKSRWTFSKKIKFMIDGISAYSYFPFRIMTAGGIVVVLAGFVYGIWTFLARIVAHTPMEGWQLLIILVLVLAGVQMLMLGIVGEYLWRTLDQVRNRPPYVIEKIYK